MDAAFTQQHVNRAQKLFDQGLFKSAELMLGVVISKMPAPHDLLKLKGKFSNHQDVSNATECFESQVYMLLADCLTQRNEYRRAMGYYAKALQRLKTMRSDVKSADKSKSFLHSEYLIREKYATSCIRVGEFAQVKSILEPIPLLSRTIPCLLLLAQTYEQLADNPSAIDCYHHIARIEPDALEAHLALVRLGVPLGQILTPIQSGDDENPSHKRRIADTKHSDNWMTHYVIGCHFQHTLRYQDALELFIVLESKFRENIDVLLRMADCNAKLGNPSHAYYLYSQVRKIDPDMMDHMDRFANLIKMQGKSLLVCKLAEDMLRVNQQRPECYVTLGRYCEMKNDLEKALQCADKALELDNHHVEAYELKGSLLSALDRPTEALAVYRIASRFTQDLFVFQGIIESYVALNKIKEALVVAREALRLMPNNSKALTLVGIVLSKTEASHDQAIALFEKALEKDPKCKEAVIALTSIYCIRKLHQKAIDILESHLRIHHSDVAHSRLGQIYLLIQDYSNALSSFNQALRINPDCVEAQQGLHAVEQAAGYTEDATGSGFMDS